MNLRLKYSFGHALRGMKEAFETQPNFRIHIFSAAVITIISLWLDITAIEWVFIIMSIMFVIVSELLNTAVEFFADLVQRKYNLTVKIIKDISAAAVLISVINAIIIGIVILGTNIYALLF